MNPRLLPHALLRRPQAAALLLTVLTPAPVWAHDCEVDGLCYNLDAATLTASVSYYGDSYFTASYSGAVSIPETIDHQGATYRVTAVGDFAFALCSDLTDVAFPASLTAIGHEAFERCSGLTQLTLPAGLVTIGEWAFSNCTGLTQLTLPASVTTVGDFAFLSCRDLATLTLGSNVTDLGTQAFYDCPSLSAIESLNPTAPAIAFDTFDNLAYAGATLSVPDEAYPSYAAAWSRFARFGVWAYGEVAGLQYVFSCAEQTASVSYRTTDYGDYSGTVTIPDQVTFAGVNYRVTSVGANAFRNCSDLVQLTLPAGLTSIDDYAFYYCSGLASLPLPDGLTTVGDYAFQGCTDLTEMDIPDGVTAIGRNAFYRCFNLAQLTLGRGLATIGDYAFRYCSALTELTLPPSLTSIGSLAFGSCTGLTAVHSNNPTPPTAPDSFDADTYAAATLYVPTGSRQAYAEADGWTFFLSVTEEEVTAALPSLAADAPAGAIYTLTGHRLAPADLDALPRGAYVAGGKKVLKQ